MCNFIFNYVFLRFILSSIPMKNIEKRSRRTSVFHNRKYLVGNTPKMGVFVPAENQRFMNEGVSEALRWVSPRRRERKHAAWPQVFVRQSGV